LKVILITPFSEFSKGGISTHIRNFKKHFIFKGIDCQVYVLSNNRFKAFIEIIRLVLSNSDIIHVHSSFFAVFCLSALKPFSTSNYCFTFHTQPNNSSSQKSSYLKYYLLNFLLNKYFNITTVSGSILNNFASIFGLNIQKFQVIHSGVDFENPSNYKITTHSNSIKIISIGLFEWDWKVQGHLLALKAFKKLQDNFANISFHLIGSGSKEYLIQNEISKLNLTKSVHIFNNISNVKDLLVNADIYLHTGLNEGCSLSILEARSFNLCTIVVDSGGNKDLIQNNINGILCDPNFYSIYESLKNVILDLDTLNRLKKDSILGIHEFMWENIIEKYKCFYLNVLNE